MKSFADQKLKTRKKPLRAPPPSMSLVSFSAILWLPSLLLLRLALGRCRLPLLLFPSLSPSLPFFGCRLFCCCALPWVAVAFPFSFFHRCRLPSISLFDLPLLSCLVMRLWLTLVTPCIAVVQNGRHQRKRSEEDGPREKNRVVSALTPTLTLTQTLKLIRNSIINACVILTHIKVSERHSSSSHRRRNRNSPFSHVLSP